MTLSRLDRALLSVAPQFAARRLRARALALTYAHYEAAQGGRRTDGWTRMSTDVNAANAAALPVLRDHARDLIRNNPWAERGKQVIANNTVGWGIMPKPIGDLNGHAVKRARTLWKAWGHSTQCDLEGQRDFYGLQRLVMETVAESGEVIVRRYRVTNRGLAIPMQLQVLEGDYLDTTRDLIATREGGKIIQGVEFDAMGRRVAYWLFPEHPGSANRFGTSRLIGTSQRVPADGVLHVYRKRRPGQVRAVTWYAPVIARLKGFDVFEDAALVQQQVAACLAGFITDTDGTGVAVGDKDASDPLLETIQPGTLQKLPVGKSITFTTPPRPVDGRFDQRQLRAIAAGLGITYEELTGDYSAVNFSSARMARLAHWANVHDWRWNLIIPMFCGPCWDWAMETAFIAGSIGDTPAAEWTPPPMPLIEPDKEARAGITRVRGGQALFDDLVREQGLDPETFWPEYAANLKRLDDLGIVLDSDARKTTQAGNPTDPGESSGKVGNSEE